MKEPRSDIKHTHNVSGNEHRAFTATFYGGY